MVKKQYKALCIVLTVVLTLTAFFAVSLTAMAASGDTIYVKADNGWSNLYCYMWNGDGGSGNQNAAWPGVKMTSLGNSVYSYRLTGDYGSLIFNNGNEQTGNLTYAGNAGDGKIYSLKNETWSQYVEATTGSGTETQPATQPAVSGSGTTVYLQNSAGWSSPRCYMWNSTSDSNANWPGKVMTKVSDNVWMYSADKTFANCIFSDNGNSQTTDLTAQNGYIYDNKSNTWEVYDTSPLQVKSYSTDPDSNIYKGMEVTLSAQAVSTQGGSVNYKFSVKNASGTTTVIRDFTSANTVAWTPTATGEYTIIFDFNDTLGNTNSREIKLNVLDDSTLTKPVIKKVTPSTGSYVQTGKASNISVTAGGGKTGTNLLFYKYVIEDPNGEKNTAYYTLNNTYSFTPYTEGEYKVTVYVQASDNSTVNKSYTLRATGGTIPTSAPATAYPTQPTTVQPTTVKPTVQPTTVQPTTVQPTTVQPTTVKPTVQPTTVQPTTVQPTTVQPTTQPGPIVGDVNGDGAVNIKDATYLQMALIHFKGYKVNAVLADFNGDGNLSIKDVTAIQRHSLKNLY